MNCATSCVNVAVGGGGGHDCFTNRHLVICKGLNRCWQFYNSPERVAMCHISYTDCAPILMPDADL